MRTHQRLLIAATLVLAILQASEAKPQNPTSTATFVSCPHDPQKQHLRSSELQQLRIQDQADRQIPGDQIDWNKVSAADENRAKRVAEIFAEGCFKEAQDYAAAALIFQHGVVPDHYYQAYLWSKRALELGDLSQNQMIANTIDRYLISLGYKQLFGAQSFRKGPNGCHCLGQTETSFSEQSRLQVCGIGLKDRIQSLKDANKTNPLCEDVLFCDNELQSPPQGLIPGIW